MVPFAARARLCTHYIKLLGNAEFVAKSGHDRVSALRKAFLEGAVGMDASEAFDTVLQRHFDRDHGCSLARALHATIRAREFSDAELEAFLIDGISYIPNACKANTLVVVEEVLCLVPVGWLCLSL